MGGVGRWARDEWSQPALEKKATRRIAMDAALRHDVEGVGGAGGVEGSCGIVC